MINPFIICNIEEQAQFKAYEDREYWQHQCLVLGATTEQLRVYDQDAQRYAATTIYPNHHVVAYARQVALEALKRGERMPTNAEQAMHDEEMRTLARLLS